MNALFDADRSLLPWWFLVAILTAIVLAIAYAFVGTIVVGIFFYYAMRPINRRIRRFTSARRFAAVTTLVLVLLPIIVFLSYTLFVGLESLNMALSEGIRQALQPYVDLTRWLEEPQTLVTITEQLQRSAPLQGILTASIDVLVAVTNALVHVGLIVAIVYYLLRDGARIEAWFREEVGPDSAAYAYASAVDTDLETVYFGNVIALVMITLGAIVWYHGYNMIAPPHLQVPVPMLLGLLTGIASIIPIIVGKLVYLPITGYLVLLAIRASPVQLWYPALFGIVSLVVLDLIPQSFIQPYIAGRKLHVGLTIFAYVFGGLFFGWYGLFLGPIILVFALQAIRLVITDLLHGGPVTPRPTAARDLGSDPALEADE
ncbi:AI-2E family transporter [Halocatena halophila]|uniref:AI-2E family transporter n=1 Tax=Halocatena halophila TaxID=2814576 RepID=UPI002ED08D11